MRQSGGLKYIVEACEKLRARHKEHISVYGEGNENRLTTKHETSSMDKFTVGIYNRGASIRIPLTTIDGGCGYLEDRRPAANMNPYPVLTALLETICGDGFSTPVNP